MIKLFTNNLYYVLNNVCKLNLCKNSIVTLHSWTWLLIKYLFLKVSGAGEYHLTENYLFNIFSSIKLIVVILFHKWRNMFVWVSPLRHSFDMRTLIRPITDFYLKLTNIVELNSCCVGLVTKWFWHINNNKGSSFKVVSIVE